MLVIGFWFKGSGSRVLVIGFWLQGSVLASGCSLEFRIGRASFPKLNILKVIYFLNVVGPNERVGIFLRLRTTSLGENA